MTANVAPIYPRTPQIEFANAVIGPSANTAQDGTGANTYAVFQADATEGSFVERLRLTPVGSPAGTVARIFICSDTGAFTPGTTNTAANTVLWDEITLPAITLSQVGAQTPADSILNLYLPAGYRLLVTFGTSTGAAGTGYRVTAVGGKL